MPVLDKLPLEEFLLRYTQKGDRHWDVIREMANDEPFTIERYREYVIIQAEAIEVWNKHNPLSKVSLPPTEADAVHVQQLEAAGWLHASTFAECRLDSWAFPWERREQWPQEIREKVGTRHYWDTDEALLLQRRIEALQPKPPEEPRAGGLTINEWVVKAAELRDIADKAVQRAAAAEEALAAAHRSYRQHWVELSADGTAIFCEGTGDVHIDYCDERLKRAEKAEAELAGFAKVRQDWVDTIGAIYTKFGLTEENCEPGKKVSDQLVELFNTMFDRALKAENELRRRDAVASAPPPPRIPWYRRWAEWTLVIPWK